jgi:hypothetical protein
MPASFITPAVPVQPYPPGPPTAVNILVNGDGTVGGYGGVIPWRALGEVVTGKRVCGAWTRMWRQGSPVGGSYVETVAGETITRGNYKRRPVSQSWFITQFGQLFWIAQTGML